MVVQAHGLTGLYFLGYLLLVLLEKGIQDNILTFFPSFTLLVRVVPAVGKSVASVGRRTLMTPMRALPRVAVRSVNGPGVLVLSCKHLLLQPRLLDHAVTDKALQPVLVLLQYYLCIGQRLLLFQGARIFLLLLR